VPKDNRDCFGGGMSAQGSRFGRLWWELGKKRGAHQESKQKVVWEENGLPLNGNLSG